MILEGGGPATDRAQLFGADWCGDCRRTKTWLRRHAVPFVEFDADDAEVRARAAEIAGGLSSIPVLVTPDGTVLVEPTNAELAAALPTHGQRTGRSGCR